MFLSISEKQEIIHLVVRSEIGINLTVEEIGLNKSTFYNCYDSIVNTKLKVSTK